MTVFPGNSKWMNPSKCIAVLFALMLMLPAYATAAATPSSETLEETRDYQITGLHITIEQWLWTYRQTRLRFFVADVQADSPEQLQTAFAMEEYSTNGAEETGTIAQRHDAILAINGDYYNYRDKNGLVIRNGVLYRDCDSTRDQLLIYADGHFEALPRDYSQGNGQAYVDEGVVQCLTFGPLLVQDGQAVTLPEKYIIYTKDTVREPRTAIGWVNGTHYVLIVADGRRDGWSDKGMTLQELQRVFVERKCQVAYNLDGGGSATMILNGEQVNKTSGSRERKVSDIIYFVGM